MEEWQCPYCCQHQQIDFRKMIVKGVSARTRQLEASMSSPFSARAFNSAHSSSVAESGQCIVDVFANTSASGDIVLLVQWITCVNKKCRKLSLSVQLMKVLENPPAFADRYYYSPIQSWELLPESMAKLQPDYIPEPIRQDYEEACKIRTLSSKASATLARRCLQGMIRDFCKIKEQTLFKEIKKLKEQMDTGNAPKGVMPEAVEAIDAVRKVGNIGAHMAKETDLIIDIDPDEAGKLIGLIEMLFDDWYVARHDREQRLKGVLGIAKEKTDQKQKKKGAS